MENIDRMILDVLRNDLHCSIEDDAKIENLNDLNSEQIVEGIVRCLWKCNPSTVERIFSYKLTKNTVDRFRIASKITDEIKSLKIREEIGYQALLYPNVFDSRRIFLALLEKLPKETIKVDETKLSALERIKSDVGDVIAKQMDEQWVPEYCRFYELKRIGRFWHSKDNLANFWDQFDQQFAHQMEKKRLEAKPETRPKPKLPPKPTLVKQQDIPQNEKIQEKDKKIQMQPCKSDENFDEHHIEKDEIAKMIDKKRTVLAEKQKILMELQMKVAEMTDELQNRQKMVPKHDERMLLLLQDPVASVEKLQVFIADAGNRQQALQEKFFAAKTERLEQLNQNGDRAAGSLTRLKQMTEALEQLLEERKRIKAKLLKENEKAAKNRPEHEAELIDNRNKIVRRILEISSIVAKQNDEIRRTANSVQVVRKEIDQLEGNLDRTFIAVNRWLGAVADRSAKMQRTYKMLVRIHEQCALVKETIQEQGQLCRQIDELGDRVELETQKGVDGQLERLLEDLMLIRNENHKLQMTKSQREQQRNGQPTQ